jgi:hypothetical protein
VSLDGLYRYLEDARGADSFQLLCLALTSIRNLLEDAVTDGGLLLDIEEDAPFDFSAHFGRMGE